LHETLAGAVPGLRFGIAFCESSGPRLVRRSGNDPQLVELATHNALRIGAGHSFIVFLRDGFPVNVLNQVKWLIRDFLSGVFILVEDQFGVGDVVDVDEAIGTVEAATFQIEGNPYFSRAHRGTIPDGAFGPTGQTRTADSERSSEMWRRSCPLLTLVLAVGVVFMRRRLREAEAELERARTEAGARRARVAEPAPAERAAAGDRVATTGGGEQAEAATTSELSAEWEQAVPPMDS
jgi:hypothetical protein